MTGKTAWGKRPTSKTTTSTPTLDDFVKGAAGDMARIHCIIPTELHKRVKMGCALEGVTMTDVIAELLEARFPVK